MHVLTRADVAKIKEVRLVGKSKNDLVTATEALNMAEEEGLDLVCVSDQSSPMVVRIQDFKKLEYERKKTRKLQKAKTHQSELKEIQLKVNISDHDLETKMNNIRRFLERGDKVKLMVRLKGRERESPARAQQLIDKVTSTVECKASKLPGPMNIAILEPPK